MLPERWPAELRNFLGTEYGPLHDVRQLSGGQSGAAVYLVAGAERTVVVKTTFRPSEPAFYFEWAPILRPEGVPVPALYRSRYISGESAYETQNYISSASFGLRHADQLSLWMVLEHIPSPLPSARYLADAEMMGILYRLHSIAFRFNSTSGNVEHLFEPKWTEAMNQATVQFAPEEERVDLFARLEALRKSAQQLFLPRCFISGDPNRTNWGLRADGSLVLFDWERFGLGTPALDLAIATPGLPSMADIRKTAEAYARHSPAGMGVEALSRDIAAAKVWNIAEYVHEATSGMAKPNPATVANLKERLPGWLVQVLLTFQ